MKSCPQWFLCLSLLSWWIQAYSQESAVDRQGWATNQLKRLAVDMSSRCMADIRSLEDWKSRRPEVRRQLLEMLGLDPLPGRTPMQAQITGSIDAEKFHIEKIVFQSLPGLYVTGNFYIPKGPAKALPTILYLCGHSPHRLGAKYQYQDRAAWFAAHGFSCLILDTLEFAEVAGIHHGTHDLNMWHWLSLGYTPAGVEVWNAIRALDYLETRPEVDARHIGLTGISGGGAMTWYVAAVDDRIAAAAPVCSTFTFGSQAEHWVARGQCDCIYYHNTYGWDFPMLAALIAPRPLLMLNGQKDSIFPPDGYHAVFQKAQGIYSLHGASDHVKEIDDNVEHSDPPLFLREARQWMVRWVKDENTTLPEETNNFAKVSAEDLACLKAIPRDAINFSVHDRFAKLASPKEPRSTAAWQQRRSDLTSQLHEKVFRWFPTNAAPFETKSLKGSGGWVPRYDYANYKEVSFQSEEGIRIRAQLLTPKNAPARTPLLIYVKRAQDSFYFSDWDELLPLFSSHTVLVLNPRFTELALGPADYAEVERTAVWVGRTISAMQVWDILRSVDWAVNEERLAPTSINFYGKGEMGVLGLYAALLDTRIDKVILNDPPASHRQGPALLNGLRVTDIPEVAGALAPRRVVSITKLPESFQLARSIYRLQNASESFTTAASLPEALEIWKAPADSKER